MNSLVGQFRMKTKKLFSNVVPPPKTTIYSKVLTETRIMDIIGTYWYLSPQKDRYYV